MKYLITLFAAMCMATLVNAQSHTFKQCHLNPKWENAKKDVENSGPSCVACVKNDEKERLAKIAEKKQRDDMHNAKVAAELAAKKKAYAEEQKRKREEASRHSGDVVINAQPSPKMPIAKSKVAAYSKGFFYNGHCSMYGLNGAFDAYCDPTNGFIVNGDTILKDKYKMCSAIYNGDGEGNKYKFPAGVGIVVLKENKIINAGTNGRKLDKTVQIADLVDFQGKRLINDNSVTGIRHIYGDYFLLLKGYGFSGSQTYTFDDVEIYNIRNKEVYPLKRHNRYNRVEVGNIIFHELPYAVYTGLGGEYCKPTGTFKALVATEVDYKEFRVYYINNDNTIEEQFIKR